MPAVTPEKIKMVVVAESGSTEGLQKSHVNSQEDEGALLLQCVRVSSVRGSWLQEKRILMKKTKENLLQRTGIHWNPSVMVHHSGIEIQSL